MDEVPSCATVNHPDNGCRVVSLFNVHGECEVFFRMMSYGGEYLGGQGPWFRYVFDGYWSSSLFFVRFGRLMREFLLIFVAYVFFVLYRNFGKRRGEEVLREHDALRT